MTTSQAEQQLRYRAKAALRQQMQAVRRALPEEARRHRTEKICDRLASRPELIEANVIVAYAAIDHEPDLARIVGQARQANKTIAFPRVDPDRYGLRLHVVERDDQLDRGAFGVLEPPVSAPECDPDSVDLILVPGLAFDERGFRIGYGKGFYDRLLPSLPRAARCATGYDFQLIAEVPETPDDAPMHLVITDERVIECPAAS